MTPLWNKMRLNRPYFSQLHRIVFGLTRQQKFHLPKFAGLKKIHPIHKKLEIVRIMISFAKYQLNKNYHLFPSHQITAAKLTLVLTTLVIFGARSQKTQISWSSSTAVKICAKHAIWMFTVNFNSIQRLFDSKDSISCGAKMISIP